MSHTSPVPMAAPLYGLLYRSRAARGLLAADLSDILDAAVQRNTEFNVTGLLVYSEQAMAVGVPGQFAQWLEGDEKDVLDIYATIEHDRRHTDLELLAAGTMQTLTGADARLFPAWAMALQRQTALPATVAGFVEHARRGTR